jgi:hypothetical protein
MLNATHPSLRLRLAFRSLAVSPTTFISNIIPRVMVWFMKAFCIRGAYRPARQVSRVVSAFCLEGMIFF